MAPDQGITLRTGLLFLQSTGSEGRCKNPSYYREQAERARRLGRSQTNREVEAQLNRMARDYDDLAEDLDNGAVEIRHPELMPQRRD